MKLNIMTFRKLNTLLNENKDKIYPYMGMPDVPSLFKSIKYGRVYDLLGVKGIKFEDMYNDGFKIDNVAFFLSVETVQFLYTDFPIIHLNIYLKSENGDVLKVYGTKKIKKLTTMYRWVIRKPYAIHGWIEKGPWVSKITSLVKDLEKEMQMIYKYCEDQTRLTEEKKQKAHEAQVDRFRKDFK